MDTTTSECESGPSPVAGGGGGWKRFSRLSKLSYTPVIIQ